MYSISVDECTVDSSPSTVLRQVEIEYVRSRVLHQPADMEFIEQELMSVVGSVQEYLERRGFKVRRGYYSKLSFLRDHAMELVDGGTAG